MGQGHFLIDLGDGTGPTGFLGWGKAEFESNLNTKSLDHLIVCKL